MRARCVLSIACKQLAEACFDVATKISSAVLLSQAQQAAVLFCQLSQQVQLRSHSVKPQRFTPPS